MGAIGRQWGPYSYAVPGLWHGRHGRILVIGDKKGGKTSLRLSMQPDLLDRLQEVVGRAPKLIHVVRDPFDNIFTISRKHFQGDINRAVEYYETLCATNEDISRKRARNVCTIFYEDFLESPRDALVGLCDFLGLPISQAFMEGCEKVVKAPVGIGQRREQFGKEQVVGVERLIERYSFLHRYRV